jgi:predicted DNA-binding protein (MmcQ/YjbR family)
MNLEDYRTFCLSFSGAIEDLPFDNKTLAFKVGNKIFALLDVEEFNSVNLKCNPEYAIELREQFSAVIPGYHMNKKHWNTVSVNADLDDSFLLELTRHSYDLVFQSLTKNQRDELSN